MRDLLEKSKDIKFLPELERNLRTVKSLSSSFAASINPTLGDQNERAQELERRRHETELLEAELANRQAQKKLDDFGAAEAGGSAEPSPEADPALQGDVNDLKKRVGDLEQRDRDAGASESAEAKKLKVEFERLKAELNAKKSDIATLENEAKAGTKGTDVGATPFDEFRDRQAYRREIRAALAEVGLDDLLDFEGNSLYRLQFRATILPGENRDQMGVARLTLTPPKMAKEVDRVYAAWLEHLTHRLNRRSPDGVNIDLKYELLAAQSGLFEVARISFQPDNIPSKDDPCLTGDETDSDSKDGLSLKNDSVIKNISNFKDGSETKKVSIPKCRNIALAVPPKMANPVMGFLRNKAIYENELAYADISEIYICGLVKAAPFVASSIRGLGNYEIIPADVRYRAAEIIAAYDRFIRIVRNKTRDECKVSLAAPKEFEDWLTGADSKAQTGDIRIYATGPIERAQQISTLSSAAHTVSLGFAISASLPTSGVDLSEALEYLQESIGSVEGRERVPLVVGFAGHTQKTDADENTQSISHFGWIFGPKVRIDTEEDALALEHVVNNQAVFADVSLPYLAGGPM